VESRFLPAAPGMLMTAEEFARSTGGRALMPGDVASLVRGGIGAGEAGPPSPPPPPIETATGGGTPVAATTGGAPTTINPMVPLAEVRPPNEPMTLTPAAPPPGPPGPPPMPAVVVGFAGPGGGGPPPAPTPEQMMNAETFEPRPGRYGPEAAFVESALAARGVRGPSLFERIMALGPDRQAILTDLIRRGMKGYKPEEPTRRPGELFGPDVAT